MAKIEQLEPRIHLREQWLGSAVGAWRRPVMPIVQWGAVIAGVSVGMSVQLVLMLFGFASGLSVDANSDGIGMGALAWTVVGLLTTSFIGGFVSARMSGLRRKADGLLHGAVSWAVLTLAFAALAAYAGDTFPGSVFTGMPQQAARGVQADDYRLTLVLRGMIGGDVSVADMQTLQRYILFGQREEATLLLSAMGMDPIQAAMVVDQAIIFSERAQAESAQAMTDGRAQGAEAWWVFGGALLSLLLGMAGGLVGALGSRRLVWSKPDATGGRGAEAESS